MLFASAKEFRFKYVVAGAGGHTRWEVNHIHGRNLMGEVLCASAKEFRFKYVVAGAGGHTRWESRALYNIINYSSSSLQAPKIALIE